MPGTGLLRRAEERSVTDIELFFDLVYVSAVTQPSHRLLEHTTLGGAIETAVLLALVWQAWVYTTWVTNWLDADPHARAADARRGDAREPADVGCPAPGLRGPGSLGRAYATMQIGRTSSPSAASRRGPCVATSSGC